jgi:type IV secretion system protein VirD4
MSAAKILWGQITIVAAIVLIAVWAATQWTSWRLGFQPQLGRPWFEPWPSMPVCLPPAFFWWWYAYDAYAPRIFLEGGGIAASGGFIAIAVAIGTPDGCSQRRWNSSKTSLLLNSCLI